MNFGLDLFYLFSFILIASSLVVVTTRNMVHAVMFLVLCFLNASALFVLVGAEFLAMLLIVVYVGAIAVLFLFVVMMLNVDFDKKIKHEINRHLPVLLLIGLVVFVEIFLVIQFSGVKFYQIKTAFPTPNDVHNTKAIGNLLYTDFILPFQLSGAILFVAMIGAIVLTIKDDNRFIRKQKICDQVLRNKSNSLLIAKVKIGEGIEKI